MIRRLRQVAYVVLTLVVLVGISPVLSVIWAGWVAGRHGCDLDEGSIHPCLIDGQDWGPTLYQAAMMGWFALVTLPFAAVALLGLAILAVIDIVGHLRRRRG